MQQLAESLFAGTWRSYKAFLQSGGIKNHTKENYVEFMFNDTKQLTITACCNGKNKKPDETKDWELVFKDKRHYLSVNSNGLEYEVITINHVAFVVLDMKTNEKLFCARLQTWERYVNSPLSPAVL